MALVAYSDSEGSDSGAAPTPALASNVAKVIHRSGPRKITVDLPTLQPEPGAEGEAERPAKRARTAGASAGFNSLLPPPKRSVQNNAPRAGVSLKTSGQAAFSREPVEVRALEREIDAGTEDVGATAVVPEVGTADGAAGQVAQLLREKEVKTIGRNTRFKPLSVQNKKKKKAVKTMDGAAVALKSITGESTLATGNAAIAIKPKPKKSLFSVPAADTDDAPIEMAVSAYEPLIASSQRSDAVAQPLEPALSPTPMQAPPDPNSLDAIAADLNLTPAQKRHLFGRNAKATTLAANNVKVTTFNTSAEYAANEQLRQAGEVTQHRAVKSIAPGKHSLQQLVNSAATQKDALEDHWAEGKRNRGESGSKYGWGR